MGGGALKSSAQSEHPLRGGARRIGRAAIACRVFASGSRVCDRFASRVRLEAGMTGGGGTGFSCMKSTVFVRKPA